MTSTVDLTLGREQVADVVEALRHRASGIRSGCDSYNVPELVARAELLDGLADAIDHKAAGQLELKADHCPECGLDVTHDGHLPDCPIAASFVPYDDEPEPFEGGDGSEPGPAGGDDLLDDPAEHECDCMCQACTDQWRPEDASYAILESERAAARLDPRGERDR